MRYTIDQIQRAMEHWAVMEGPRDGISIGPMVALLADVWGPMVYEKRLDVDAADLTDEQIAALKSAGI
ncbi:DUF3717 domain-containing protein [Achromobacter insolitus]|uniref:DUF3717 domain-containing protein n=1 Tax=Achromobacter insolitus TaxID=217204 RepID=UPI0007C293C2|nr:DUF3717 domain-containing protein [Achromobacter insolitus]OAD16488.1 hypothetical protein A3839_28475 [Achromobacter insolitus]